MELSPLILKWLTFLLRWGHVFFAITWIGNSFLFNYLDNKLKKNLENKEVEAEGILQHSGYYYKLTRFNALLHPFTKSTKPLNSLRLLAKSNKSIRYINYIH